MMVVETHTWSPDWKHVIIIIIVIIIRCLYIRPSMCNHMKMASVLQHVEMFLHPCKQVGS
jgi:hypothetical protein